MTIDELYKYLRLITPAGCRILKRYSANHNDVFGTVFDTECIHVYHVEPKKDDWYVILTDLVFFKTKRGALMIYLQSMRLPEWLTTAFKLRPKPKNNQMFYVTPRF